MVKNQVHINNIYTSQGFPGGSDNKESASKAGALGSIPESGSTTGGGNGYLFQYSCLENPVDRGAWHTIVHGVERVRHD